MKQHENIVPTGRQGKRRPFQLLDQANIGGAWHECITGGAGAMPSDHRETDKS